MAGGAGGGAHSLLNRCEVVPAQELWKLFFDPWHKARPLVDKARVQLHEGSPGFDLLIGILAAGDASNAYQWNPP